MARLSLTVRHLRLTFDRGTVVLTEEGDHLDLASVPGVVWDARVSVHRAPTYRCAAVAAELRTKGVQITDATTSFVRPRDMTFRVLCSVTISRRRCSCGTPRVDAAPSFFRVEAERHPSLWAQSRDLSCPRSASCLRATFCTTPSS